MAIRMVAFDADDTLWRSEEYFREAEAKFHALVARYVDTADVAARLYAVEKRNLALFGYGVKGMVLSMLESAFEITQGRVSASDMHRIVEMGKRMLQHPVELLPGVAQMVAEVAAQYPIVLVTKGDLFHQETKVRESGLARWFGRIEIVSEKDTATYARLLREVGVAAGEWVMVGNSLRSDIAPVLALGGWGIHVPYPLTWVHEEDVELDLSHPRLLQVEAASQVPQALAQVAAAAAT